MVEIFKLPGKLEILKIKQDSNIFIYGAIVTLFALFILTYFPSLSVVHEYWSDMSNTYAHGYMLFGIVIYLLYIARKKIFLLNQRVSTQYFLINLAAIFLFSILWFLANSTQVQIVQLLACILLIWLWIAMVYGRTSAIRTFVPMGLLLMGIPLWDGIGIYLQAMTVFVTQFWLSLFGVTAFFDGNFIELADGVLEISEGCSGLKYFLAGTSLAIVYAEMNLNTFQRKTGIVLLAVLISIFANWIRVFSLVLIADISKMQSSLVHEHDNFGWLVFIVFFIIFFVIANKVDPGYKVDRELSHIEPSNSNASKLTDNSNFRAFSATLTAGILPVFSWFAIEGNRIDLLIHQLEFEEAKEINDSNWLPNYTGFDESNTWRVIVNSREVDITIISYRDQKQGKELIYYSNTLNDSKYAITNMDGLEISNGLGINRSILSNQYRKILVGWYYKVGNVDSNSANMAKLLQISSIIQGVPIASLITISIECKANDCSREMNEFLSAELIEGVVDSIVVRKRTENKS